MKKYSGGGRVLRWMLKYKLHHIPLWCLYHYLWWTVAVANPWKAAASIFFTPLAVKFIFYVVFQALAVYLNLYYLVPKFLEREKVLSYAFLLSSAILGASLCIVGGYYLTAIVYGQTVSQLFGAGTCFFYFFARALPSTVASVTLAFCINLVIKRLTSIRKQQTQERERLQAELKFLKHQFNPHFLFNSINTIFFLINTNPKKASASLSMFSDLLRHQLYDCNDDLIPLSKEITYLQNFVALEKLRQKNLDVIFDIGTEHAGHLLIAPFILVTFVENAFKHVSRYKDKPNTIHIDLRLTGKQLYFTARNTVSVTDRSLAAYTTGGIGLQNVKRRLGLVYNGGLHSLDIEHTDDAYTVRLYLQLTDRVITATEARVPMQMECVV